MIKYWIWKEKAINWTLSSCGWVAGLSINTVRQHVALPLTSTTLLFIFPGFFYFWKVIVPIQRLPAMADKGWMPKQQEEKFMSTGGERRTVKSGTWWWSVWWGHRGTWRAPSPPRCGTQSCGQKRTGCGLERTGSSLKSHCGLFGRLTSERYNTTHLRPSKMYAPAEGIDMYLWEKQNQTIKYEQIQNNKWGID